MGWDFHFSRETEIAAIDDAVRKPAERELLTRGLGAFAKAVETRFIGADDLKPLLEGLGHSSEAVWGRSGSWLVRLSNGFDEARKALREAVSASRWTVRFHALACLDNPAPPELRAELIRAALNDPDARIRVAGANMCLRCGLRELIRDLETACGAEPDSATRETMQLNIPLLRGEKVRSVGGTIERLRNGNIVISSESSRIASDGENIFVRTKDSGRILDAMKAYCETRGRVLVQDSRTHRPLVGAKEVEMQGGRYFVLTGHPDGWISIRERGGKADALLAKTLREKLRMEVLVLPKKTDPPEADRIAASHQLPSPFRSYQEVENDPRPSPDEIQSFICFRKKDL
jgi:hypothetical protein